MTCSYVSGSGLAAHAGGGAGTLTLAAYAAGGGDALWVSTAESGGETVTGVTFNGISLTKIVGPIVDGGFFLSNSIWVLTKTNGAVGTHDIVVSFTSGSHNLIGFAWLTTGTNQATPNNTAVTEGATSGTSTANLTSVIGDANGVFFDVLCVNNEATQCTGFGGGNGQTQIDNSPHPVGTSLQMVVGQKAGAASTTLGGWSWTTGAHNTDLAFGVNAAPAAALLMGQNCYASSDPNWRTPRRTISLPSPPRRWRRSAGGILTKAA